jgi:hypothetical protein
MKNCAKNPELKWKFAGMEFFFLTIFFCSIYSCHSSEKKSVPVKSPVQEVSPVISKLFVGSDTSMKVEEVHYFAEGKGKLKMGKCNLIYDTLHLISFLEKDSAGIVESVDFTTDRKLNLIFSFFINGLLREITLQKNEFDEYSQSLEKYYSAKGELISELFTTTLPNCPDDVSNIHGLNIYSVKYYEHNQLKYKGSVFIDDVGDHDDDSVGEWKFYSNGKLIQTKKFHSWQDTYKKDHHCKPDFEIPYKW